MAALKTTVPFTKPNVDAAPTVAGVYVLYSGTEIIYIGRAQGNTVTIRSRLQDHFSGREGACTQRAAHCWYEENTSPVTREVQLLEDFQRANGRLPACNSRIG